MQISRSILFTVLLFLSVLVFSIPVMLSLPLPYRYRYALAPVWARMVLWLLRTLCGLGHEVAGRDNVPDANAIIFCKHQSAWETIALLTIFPPHTWVLKRELMWAPFLGWAIAVLNPIAVHRGGGQRAVSQVIDQGARWLREGRWVAIFPEGTRLPPGTTRRYGIGGAALAVTTGTPVVPVAHNAGTYWPRRGLRKRPGTIRVVIGEPIDPRGKTPAEVNDAAQAWIEARMRELES